MSTLRFTISSYLVQYRSSDYDDFMSKIAKQIGLVGLEIRRTLDEKNGSHVLGLVSVASSKFDSGADYFESTRSIPKVMR